MIPWWHFSLGDVVYYAVFLTIAYAILGPPHGLWWLLVAPLLLGNRWLFSKLRRPR